MWQVFLECDYMALHASRHYTSYIKEGRQAEKDDNPIKASEWYEMAIKQRPLEELPYHRLMIIYRKQKKFKEEARVLDKALNVFKSHYDEKQQKLFGKNKKIEQTGKALLRSLTPKGSKNNSYYPEPIPKWTRRKENLEKKLK